MECKPPYSQVVLFLAMYFPTRDRELTWALREESFCTFFIMLIV